MAQEGVEGVGVRERLSGVLERRRELGIFAARCP